MASGEMGEDSFGRKEGYYREKSHLEVKELLAEKKEGGTMGYRV